MIKSIHQENLFKSFSSNKILSFLTKLYLSNHLIVINPYFTLFISSGFSISLSFIVRIISPNSKPISVNFPFFKSQILGLKVKELSNSLKNELGIDYGLNI
ncbi:MAG: hypothetical protein NHF97_00335, partial [Flavobacteriia bacterium]|nr:hypothetical protein [Candidatus Bostrichicola ureolyticus]